ncbi:MAG: hypothetical protein OXD33_11110 [Rhodobacteraceae bacterium]|nr:hypothetical protein [Paracoccaceae bacterium]MCY4326356.1 hypothetical protein [Paracoccaceae bacterium]
MTVLRFKGVFSWHGKKKQWIISHHLSPRLGTCHFIDRFRQRLDLVQRAVGRLQEENARVAHHEMVTVTPNDTGQTATAGTGVQNTEPGSMMEAPGVTCLHTNILDGDTEHVWRAYACLTAVESIFRALKSERGLRPIFHHRGAGWTDIC